jgi:hypothetical protein
MEQLLGKYGNSALTLKPSGITPRSSKISIGIGGPIGEGTERSADGFLFECEADAESIVKNSQLIESSSIDTLEASEQTSLEVVKSCIPEIDSKATSSSNEATLLKQKSPSSFGEDTTYLCEETHKESEAMYVSTEKVSSEEKAADVDEAWSEVQKPKVARARKGRKGTTATKLPPSSADLSGFKTDAGKSKCSFVGKDLPASVNLPASLDVEEFQYGTTKSKSTGRGKQQKRQSSAFEADESTSEVKKPEANGSGKGLKRSSAGKLPLDGSPLSQTLAALFMLAYHSTSLSHL